MRLASLSSVLLGVSICALVGARAAAQVDVLTQHNDNARTGANLRETVLTPANVNKAQFGMLFKHVLDDQSYTQPLVVTNVAVSGGARDIVYVTTVANSVYAFDANDPAATAPVWHVNFGTPADLNSAKFGCLDINGRMGIIGTPVIDKERRVLYVVALTRAGAGFTQRLHALDLATGADLPESPVVIQADGFDALLQNQRPALLLANGMVYVAYASHCDKEPYHGYLMAYDARTLAQVSVFNTSPSGSAASIWQSGQGPAADPKGSVYVVDRRPHFLTQPLIRHRIYGRLAHIRMHQQRRLDLTTSDVLAAADDQILDAVDDEKKSLRVEQRHVAGAEPAVVEHTRIEIG